MAKRKSQQLIMGEGNDVVEDWIGPGAAQVEALQEYVKHIGNGELEIDWVKILIGIEGVSARQAEDISLESDADLLTFLERFSGTNVDYEAWGGDMPGRDGIWIRVWIYADDELKVEKALEEVVSRLRDLYPLPRKL